MGLLETRLANHSDCVEASQRPFAWAPFPARAAKPEPLEPERGPARGHRHELTLIRRLYTRRAENRRESSRTHRKYEVPNHVVTQNDWQPPRRVENPRPKSGRSPVRSRPWPPGFTHPQRNRAPTDCRPCSSHRLSNRRILSRCLTAGSTSTAISKRRNPIRYKLRGLRQFPNWSKRGQPRRIGKETYTPPVRVDRSR